MDIRSKPDNTLKIVLIVVGGVCLCFAVVIVTCGALLYLPFYLFSKSAERMQDQMRQRGDEMRGPFGGLAHHRVAPLFQERTVHHRVKLVVDPALLGDVIGALAHPGQVIAELARDMVDVDEHEVLGQAQ